MQLRSSQRIQDERERAWRGRDLKRNPEIHTRRDLIIPSGTYGSILLKLINSRSGLLQESELMHNCVDDYACDINAGECAIYHVDYQGDGYTLEVRQDAKGRLKIAQLMGVANKDAPDKLTVDLNQVLADARKGEGKK